MSGGAVWRVGHRSSPLAFTPPELCSWNHRFDDLDRRFRTVYCAEHPETSLREVLADFRPNLAARQAFVDAFGVDALEDLPVAAVTASWREEHLLAPASIAGDLFDRGAAGVRFPSRLDGLPAVALFEGPAELEAADDAIALTDPPPAQLVTVCAGWALSLEPTAA